LVQVESFCWVFHLAFLHFDFNVIDVVYGVKRIIKDCIVWVGLHLFGEDSIVSKISYILSLFGLVLFRIRPHWLSILAAVQILRLHKPFFHFYRFKGLLNDHEFLLS
jgi:uncharacterized membrane protein YuzA (DUF378 family)